MTTALLRTRLALGVYNWEVWLNAVIEQGNSVDHKTVHHFLPIYSWFRVSIHAAYPRPSWIVSKGDYSKAQQQRTGNIITQHLFFFHTHSNKKENLHSCNIKRSWNATGKKSGSIQYSGQIQKRGKRPVHYGILNKDRNKHALYSVPVSTAKYRQLYTLKLNSWKACKPTIYKAYVQGHLNR